MRLLSLNDRGDLLWQEFAQDEIPPYAILSHTWGTEEVSFDDLIEDNGRSKAGRRKIEFCGKQASDDGLRYFWVDTCCIQRRDYTELTEAINSMFRWYRNAAKCYAYLSDLSTCTSDENAEMSNSAWEADFRQSRWFTRGWTLQELLAPSTVIFYCSQHRRLGDKKSLGSIIHEVTGIPSPALNGHDLHTFSTTERMSWSAKRQTTKPEDNAYCLFGIFGIFMPLIYGEGKENALKRLQDVISWPSTTANTQSKKQGYASVNHPTVESHTEIRLRPFLTWKPCFYFFYGSTRSPYNLARRLSLQSIPVMYDARLLNCSIADRGTSKVLLDGPRNHIAMGKAYLVGREDHDQILRRGQTINYRLGKCKILVRYGESAGKEEEVEAMVFKFYGPSTGLTNLIRGAKPFTPSR